MGNTSQTFEATRLRNIYIMHIYHDKKFNKTEVQLFSNGVQSLKLNFIMATHTRTSYTCKRAGPKPGRS